MIKAGFRPPPPVSILKKSLKKDGGPSSLWTHTSSYVNPALVMICISKITISLLQVFKSQNVSASFWPVISFYIFTSDHPLFYIHV